MRGVTSKAEFHALWPDAPHDGVAELELAPGLDELDTVTQLELRNYLGHQLLRDTDAMSMAHALEVRVPLLDDAVVAAALDRPRDKAGRAGKSRLAAAVHPDLLTRVDAPKLTFTLPFDSWLRGPLATTARDALDRLAEPDVGLDRWQLGVIWDRWESGHAHWRTVWALAVMGMWADANVCALR